jgi:ABC-type sugar transport system ATPase subunit
MTAPIVSLRGTSKRYGGIAALSAIDIDFIGGEVHALCGANGAGKSTLKNIVSGLVRPDAGSILVDGELVQFTTPADALKLGVHAVHQELGLIPWMSVEDNLCLGAFPQRAGLVARREQRERALAALDRLGIAASPAALVGDLSVGQQQLVEIARAVASDPRCLLLDEPSAVLVGPELERVFTAIEQLRSSGTAIVYVSHRMPEVFRLADRVSVLRNGQLARTASVAEFDERELIRSMTGAAPIAKAIRPSRRDGKERLRVTGLSAGGGHVRDASLVASAGEIVGIAGLMGSGRSHLVKVIAGFDRPDAGTVVVDEAPVRPDARSRAASGIAFVSEDRKNCGLVMELSVRTNLSLLSLQQIARGTFINRRRERELSGRLADRVGVAAPRLADPVRMLSGGNQQKVALGRSLQQHPAVLLVDEPTRGVDVGAKAEIHRLLRSLAEEGSAVVAVSSDFEELLDLVDRIYVMRSGEIVAEAESGDIDEEELLRMCSQTRAEGDDD